MDEYDYNLSDIVNGFAASYEEQAQSIKDSFGSLLDQEDSDRLESNLTVADEVEVEEEGEEEGEGDRDASAVLGDDDVDHVADAGSDTQSSEGEAAVEDTGPDPELCKMFFEQLREVYDNFVEAVEVDGYDSPKAQGLLDTLQDKFTQIKLSAPIFNRIINEIRNTLSEMREQEKRIITSCVDKLKLNRSVFVKSFPEMKKIYIGLMSFIKNMEVVSLINLI